MIQRNSLATAIFLGVFWITAVHAAESNSMAEFPRWHFEAELGSNAYLPPAFNAANYVSSSDMDGLLYGAGIGYRKGRLLLGLRGTVARGYKDGISVPVTGAAGTKPKTYSSVQRFEILPEIGLGYPMSVGKSQWIDWRASVGPSFVSLQHDGVGPKGAGFQGVYSTPLYIGYAVTLNAQYVLRHYSAGLFGRYSSVGSSASDAAYGQITAVEYGLRLGLAL
jgi:hypothetical protein